MNDKYDVITEQIIERSYKEGLQVIAEILRESFPEPPSRAEREDAFGRAVVAVLTRDHAFDTDEALEVLNAAEALLTSHPAESAKEE